MGWDFQLNRRLRQLDNGNLLISDGLCRSDEFVDNGSGFTTPPRIAATLVQNPDGSYADFPAGTTTTYKYEDARFPNAITQVIAPSQEGSRRSPTSWARPRASATTGTTTARPSRTPS